MEILTQKLDKVESRYIEIQLCLLEEANEFNFNVVTPPLEEEVAKWWETISPTMIEAGQITWPQFREI